MAIASGVSNENCYERISKTGLQFNWLKYLAVPKLANSSCLAGRIDQFYLKRRIKLFKRRFKRLQVPIRESNDRNSLIDTKSYHRASKTYFAKLSNRKSALKGDGQLVDTR